MKNKRIFVVLIIIAYTAVLFLSLMNVFALKQVNISYSVLDKDCVELESKFNALYGKNTLFINESEVEKIVEENSIYKIKSLKKTFPNRISIELCERQKVYALEHESRYVLVDEEGYVLDFTNERPTNREMIILTLNGITLSEPTIGKIIQTNDDSMFFYILQMAKSINLYNCIKEIEIEKAVQKQFAYFKTYTGVVFEISDLLNRGIDRITYAFEQYDKEENDYRKSFNKIVVSVLPDGSLRAVWSPYQ